MSISFNLFILVLQFKLNKNETSWTSFNIFFIIVFILVNNNNSG